MDFGSQHAHLTMCDLRLALCALEPLDDVGGRVRVRTHTLYFGCEGRESLGLRRRRGGRLVLRVLHGGDAVGKIGDLAKCHAQRLALGLEALRHCMLAPLLVMIECLEVFVDGLELRREVLDLDLLRALVLVQLALQRRARIARKNG